MATSDNELVWEAQEVNIRGQLTKIRQGNNIVTNFGFDDCGLPTSIVATSKMEHQYSFTDAGILDYRWDKNNELREQFSYDSNNRLTQWDIYSSSNSYSLPIVSNNIEYDPNLGNITSKSDIGFTMAYGEEGTDIHGNPTPADPHALTSIKGNPSMIPDEFQKINYNHFGKVADITEGSRKLELTYGFDEQRSIGKYFANGIQDPYLTRYYLGNYSALIGGIISISNILYFLQ